MKFRKDDIVMPIIVWTERNYQRAVELSDDAMPDTFAEWQEKFRELYSLVPPGAIIVPVEADPDEVAEWCLSNGVKVTSENRARYAVEWCLANSGQED